MAYEYEDNEGVSEFYVDNGEDCSTASNSRLIDLLAGMIERGEDASSVKILSMFAEDLPELDFKQLSKVYKYMRRVRAPLAPSDLG